VGSGEAGEVNAVSSRSTKSAQAKAAEKPRIICRRFKASQGAASSAALALISMTSSDQNALHVVIDTNVVLDWLVFAEPAALALANAVAKRQWAWCVTPPMLDELREVLRRPLAERWESARKLALTTEVGRLTTAAPSPDPLPMSRRLICRDPADQMFIDLALACTPAWLVTRDRALLALRRRAAAQGVVIANPEQWQQHHAATTASGT